MLAIIMFAKNILIDYAEVLFGIMEKIIDIVYLSALWFRLVRYRNRVRKVSEILNLFNHKPP